MKKKFFISISLITIILITLYFNINNQIGKNEKNVLFNILSNFFTYEQKDKIRNFIFIFKNQELLNDEIEELNIYKNQLIKNIKILEDEVKYNQKSINYDLLEDGQIKFLDKNLNFKKFSTSKILSGIWKDVGGSVYLDKYQNNLIVGSAKVYLAMLTPTSI